jgi:hypothetical protein
MNSSGIFLFPAFNIIILALTIGLLVAFFYLNRRRKNVFSRLAQSLEMLGFTKRGWTRQVSAIPIRNAYEYYSATIEGKLFEAHFYAVGGRRFKFKFIPYVEFALLGYFNARLAVSTPNWHLPLAWTLPQKLNLPGYEGLEIRTADENSARFLLENENTCRMVRQMLATKDAALLTIYPRDIHLTIELSDPENVSISEIQAWTRNMAGIATIAAALPPLDPEIIYNSHAHTQLRRLSARMIILLIILMLLIMPLVIIALFMGK